MDSFVSFIAMILFLVIAGIFIYTMIRGVGEAAHSSRVPASNAIATAKSKRTEKAPDNSKILGDLHYVTFILENGDELDLAVSPNEYETIECDVEGNLYYQGTRFLSFEPKKIL